MSDNYIFPENNWYIEITDDNRKIVNDWKVKQKWNKSLYENTHYKYVYFDGGQLGIGLGFVVTTEQFIKYVLKEDIPHIEEDYNYLTEILTKLNIK